MFRCNREILIDVTSFGELGQHLRIKSYLNKSLILDILLLTFYNICFVDVSKVVITAELSA